MKALVLIPSEHAASVQDVPAPTPKGKELLVKVRSIALNPVDATYVAHPLAQQERRVVGSDFAGEVVAVSDELQSSDPRIKIGARVAGFVQGACSANDRPGAFAELVTIDWDLAYLIPSHISFAHAAAVPLCGLTAAQGVFYRLKLPCPFWQAPSSAEPLHKELAADSGPVTVFIYGSATSLGMYAAQHVQSAKRVSKRPIKLIGAASAKNHAMLKQEPYLYDELVDYHDADWIAKVRASGGGKGVDFAVDCISEWPIVQQVNSTLKETTGKHAVFRSPEASPHRLEWEQMPTQPIYGAVWEGLGHEIKYHAGITVPASAEARDFATKFFGYLTENAKTGKMAVETNPVRLMPGGLDRIVPDGFALQAPGLVSERGQPKRTEEYMRPISGEKLAYDLA